MPSPVYVNHHRYTLANVQNKDVNYETRGCFPPIYVSLLGFSQVCWSYTRFDGDRLGYKTQKGLARNINLRNVQHSILVHGECQHSPVEVRNKDV